MFVLCCLKDTSAQWPHQNVILFIWLLIFPVAQPWGIQPDATRRQVFAHLPGDIIFGGLFPVHSSDLSRCDIINPERGIQRVEAMLFTLDEINNRSDILPGLNLGAIIRDTCSQSNHALEQSLEFVKSGRPVCELALTSERNPLLVKKQIDNVSLTRGHESSENQNPVRGVIGASYSTISILVANLFALFQLPQISYASTSAVLSDKRTFPLFARTVPSDVMQARAMAALVQKFNWTYVSTVRSAGDYGDSGMDAFWKEADKLGICIAAREVIRLSMNSSELDQLVRVLYDDFRKARVVVLFTRMDHTKHLLDAVNRAKLTNYFVWIASDGWGRENAPVANNSAVANGALTIEISAAELKHFSEYYRNLRANNVRNPWFRQYWEQVFNCTFGDSENFTKSNKFKLIHRRFNNESQGENSINQTIYDSLSAGKPLCGQNSHQRLEAGLDSFKQEAKVQFIGHAIYAFAHTLHKLQMELCKNPYNLTGKSKKECIASLKNFPGAEFYAKTIKNTFIGE
ncbi:unnamed protein product [Protopolystoma xenopodis]|uniref:Receptor ligand binding region domain-containing protein n=1 Tax=Protopolystoma xenopodis TaxID=117903 RepID=A0A448XNL9_9PLAT|nr:unnamed protein product [Protopolystoma xenopodis]